MHDYVIRVDKHPVGGRKTLDADILSKSLFDLVAKLNRHGCDLPR